MSEFQRPLLADPARRDEYNRRMTRQENVRFGLSKVRAVIDSMPKVFTPRTPSRIETWHGRNTEVAAQNLSETR